MSSSDSKETIYNGDPIRSSKCHRIGGGQLRHGHVCCFSFGCGCGCSCQTRIKNAGILYDKILIFDQQKIATK